MKALNSPFLTITLLIAFAALAVYAHGKAPKPLNEQPAYSQRELDKATDFVAFQIKAAQVEVYHPKTQREAALIAADVWNIEVGQ